MSWFSESEARSEATKPRCIDLFCKAGGASMGLYRAGFDVVGVDIEPQPHYPFKFYQADALTADLSEFDAVWASPPCQAYSRFTPNRLKPNHWDSIPPTRKLLEASGKPYVIENVPCSPLKVRLVLTGPMFGSLLLRERWFESNVRLEQPFFVHRLGEPLHFGGNSQGRKVASKAEMSEAMGIDWMTRDELSQAVLPSHAEFIGRQLINIVAAQRAKP